MRRSMVFEGVAVTLLILLAFLMLAMVAGGSGGKDGVCFGDIRNTYTGGDDTLYLLSAGNIYAIDDHGSLLWNYTIPGQWRVSGRWDYSPYYSRGFSEEAPGTVDATGIVDAGPIIASYDGILYIYLKPASITIPPDHVLAGNLTAISHGGKVLWSVPLESQMSVTSTAVSGGDDGWYADVSVGAGDGRVYAFHDYNETVIDARTGAVLWNVANVSWPGSIDSDGSVCIAQSGAPDTDGGNATYYREEVRDYRTPDGVVEAYGPDGTRYWGKDLGRPDRPAPGEVAFPLYRNGLVYTRMKDGVAALDREGNLKWAKSFGEDGSVNGDGASHGLSPFSAMPFDPEGNLYLQYAPPGKNEAFLIAVGPDGQELSRTPMNENKYAAVKDGTGYAVNGTIAPNGAFYQVYEVANVSDLRTDTLHAFDLKNGKALWQYTFDVRDPLAVTLNQSNAGGLMGEYYYGQAFVFSGDQLPPDYRAGVLSTMNGSSSTPVHVPDAIGTMKIEVYPGNGRVYVKLDSFNFNFPPKLGETSYVYFGGIYAFDNTGRELWFKPISPLSVARTDVTPGGIIFYRTEDGGFGVTGTGAAAGFTLTAALYIFIRFLLVGAVARSRSRLGKNENRNRVLGFIVANPGSTLYEIARGMDLNMGTIRYHTLILGLNHKVVASRMDGKYIRYFTNSGTYDRDDQLLLSLMKRDAMGKVLARIYARPGISNAELARELEMKESVVFRRAKELTDRGIVVKEAAGRKCAYYVDKRYVVRVARAMERIHRGS